MTAKPTVFVGLDSCTIVVGFEGMSSLEVLDLNTGKTIRTFQGGGSRCTSLVRIQGGRIVTRIAVGWHHGMRWVVTVFDAVTGKQLQVLAGFESSIYGLALVEDHLLTMCHDKTLRVWSQDAAGTVRRQCVRRRATGRGGEGGPERGVSVCLASFV